jgi:FdhE protein
MHRTADRLRTDPTARLSRLEQERPEWRTWVRLLAEVERHLGDATWQAPLPDIGPADATSGLPGEAPLLHQRSLRIDPDGARRLLHRLAGEAGGPLDRYRPSGADAVALLAAALHQDPARLAALALTAGLDRGALGSIAHLATLPLLQACGRLLESRVPRHWPQGYCPVCAAWPTLAERRGLDRSRQLRCGRCAAEWAVQPLCCIYCGERDHRRLGTLVPEEGGEVLQVEFCRTCGGYIKAVATLQRIPAMELLLRDLETVELDLVARDRGYGRPEAGGFPLQVRVA